MQFQEFRERRQFGLIERVFCNMIPRHSDDEVEALQSLEMVLDGAVVEPQPRAQLGDGQFLIGKQLEKMSRILVLRGEEKHVVLVRKILEKQERWLESTVSLAPNEPEGVQNLKMRQNDADSLV